MSNICVFPFKYAYSIRGYIFYNLSVRVFLFFPIFVIGLLLIIKPSKGIVIICAEVDII